MDVEGIEPGLDFTKVIDHHVGACDYFLCLIGRDWLDARDQSGARRLDDKNDFVRIEIEAALRRDVRVIPLLIDGAGMPPSEALPGNLRPLSRRNAVRLSHESFSADTDGVINTILRANAAKTGAEAGAHAARPPGTPRRVAESPELAPEQFFYTIGDQKAHFPSLTERASKLSILGRTAVNLIGHQQRAIEELCRQGCHVRLLFVDPKSEAARFLYSDNYDIYRHNVRTTALHLKKINIRCDNRIEVRVIKEAPTMSLMIVERQDNAESLIQAQLYFIHGAIAADRPLFRVKPNDRWYSVFLGEFQELWASSQIWTPDDAQNLAP
jgi:hypothetical protein